MGNEENDEKFLDTKGFRDIGSLDDFNVEITEMDAENDSGQIFDTIDDKADFPQVTLHAEGLKTVELIAEVWNQLDDNEIDHNQESMTTENNAYGDETKALVIEDGYVQIPGTTGKAIVSKRDLSGSAKGNTRFECHCGKSFSWKRDFNGHKKTHDIKFEASLRCPDCGKKFSRKVELNRHIKSVHQGYFYECPICGNRQTQADNSMTHIKKQHPGSGVKPIEKCKRK
jgi:predicted RNA-binding Zn-ribbon protein involved in translation (DUF1610 family)